jgi:hypothetical protein
MNPFTHKTTKPMEILNSCGRIPLFRWCTAWNRYGGNFSCFVARWELVTDKHFLCPEILLPVCVLLSYSVLPCQDTHCQMLHEQQQTISMRSNVREWTHVLLVNTPCSHLKSFCVTGVSCGLATGETLTRVSPGEVWIVCYTGGWTCFWFNFCSVCVIVVGCVLNGTLCISRSLECFI